MGCIEGPARSLGKGDCMMYAFTCQSQYKPNALWLPLYGVVYCVRLSKIIKPHHLPARREGNSTWLHEELDKIMSRWDLSNSEVISKHERLNRKAFLLKYLTWKIQGNPIQWGNHMPGVTCSLNAMIWHSTHPFWPNFIHYSRFKALDQK